MSTVAPTLTDWREPRHRREMFQRSYTHSLRHRNFPGMVYSMLPEIAHAFDLNEDGRAWLVWLNGNTQNVVTSLMLLEAAPSPWRWKLAVEFWNDHFKQLEWDTDRRHQKSKFGVATEKWFREHANGAPAYGWQASGLLGWETTWTYAKAQPYMGRLSAWSMMEYARILLGDDVPDMGSFLLDDKTGSRSHRNGLAFVAGHDSIHWGPNECSELIPVFDLLAETLLGEARLRNPGDANVSRLTMESALCTYKSWHKPNRRYPNVYADMMYQRIKKAEARFGRSFDLLWDIRRRTLPVHLRLEDNPYDPGLSAVKQNHYRETGQPVVLHHDFPDLEPSDYDIAVQFGLFGERKDPRWTTAS